MDWGAKQTAIATWVADITNLPVTWEDEPRKMYTTPFVMLNILTALRLGRDATKWTYDGGAAAGQEITFAQTGQREFVISMRFRSYDQRPGYSVLPYVENFRTLSETPSATATLLEDDLVLVDVKAYDADVYEFDGRRFSQATVDARFRIRELVVDPVADAYINSVIYDSNLET